MSIASDHPFKGIIYYSIAVFFFSILGALARYLSQDVAVYEILFIRSAVIAAIVMGSWAWRGEFRLLRTKRMKSHLMRSAVGLTALYLVTVSYTLLPLSEVTIIMFMNSFFVAILSTLALKENATPAQWIAIAVGFSGVALAFIPNISTFGWAVIVPFIGSFLTAVVSIFLRDMGKTENSETIVFYFALYSSLAMAGCYIWFPFMLNWTEFAILVVAGVMAYVAQMTLTLSFRFAPAPLIAPFQYVSIIWAALFGYLIWDDEITTYLIMGSLVVISAGLYLIRRTSRDRSTS